MKAEVRLSRLIVYLTQKCNMKCKHCWLRSSPSAPCSSLDIEALKRCLLKLHKIGVSSLGITGGEPLLEYDKFKEIVSFSLKIGFNVVFLETNCILINDRKVKELLPYRDKIIIGTSVDSLNPDFFDSFRNYKGALSKVLDSIKLLKKNRFKVCVVTCVYSENLAEIPYLVHTLLDKYNVDNIKLNLIVPMGGGRDIMSKEEFLKVLPKFQEMLSSLSRVYPGRIISDLPPALDDMRTVISACRAESLISILPDNAISLCGIGILHPELKVGDIRKDDIVEVWKKKKLFLDIRSLSRHNVKGVCKYCIFFKHCRTCCPAAVYDYYGTFFHSNPLCQWLWEEGLFPAKFLIQEHKLGV